MQLKSHWRSEEILQADVLRQRHTSYFLGCASTQSVNCTLNLPSPRKVGDVCAMIALEVYCRNIPHPIECEFDDSGDFGRVGDSRRRVLHDAPEEERAGLGRRTRGRYDRDMVQPYDGYARRGQGGPSCVQVVDPMPESVSPPNCPRGAMCARTQPCRTALIRRIDNW